MKLDAKVLITKDEIDITDFVISINRDWSLCNSIQSFSIVLDPVVKEILEDSYSLHLKPGMEIKISEHGIRVLTGYINTAKFSRKPEPVFEIQGADKYKLVKDYFIDETVGITNGEPVAYWIGTLLGLCDLHYIITGSEPYTYTVAPGIEFNLRSIDDALHELLAYSFSHSYCNPDGTIVIANGAVPSDLNFKTGITTVYDDTDPTKIQGGNVTRASHQVNDNNTRNVVKVWGYKGAGYYLAAGESPYIQTTAYAGLGLPVPKTTLYSSSMIQDQGTAYNLANRILAETGKFDSIKTVDCIGNPRIRVANRVNLNLNLESERIKGTAKITSVHSSMSGDGYVMQVKMDEFCPKFAAWSTVTPRIYAGLDGNGVYVSRDKGVSWAALNGGLPSGIKVSRRVGADPYGNAVSITNDDLYYETEDLWRIEELPTPQYGGYRGALKAVGGLGGYNEFAVLTAGGNGSFVYFSQSETTGSGIKETLSGWTSTKMFYDAEMLPTEISGMPLSGIFYDVTAYDMYTKTGAAYVLATIGSGTLDTVGSGTIDYPGGYGFSPGEISELQFVGWNANAPYPGTYIDLIEPIIDTGEAATPGLHIIARQGYNSATQVGLYLLWKFKLTGCTYPNAWCRIHARTENTAGLYYQTPLDSDMSWAGFSGWFDVPDTHVGWYTNMSGMRATPCPMTDTNDFLDPMPGVENTTPVYGGGTKPGTTQDYDWYYKRGYPFTFPSGWVYQGWLYEGWNYIGMFFHLGRDWTKYEGYVSSPIEFTYRILEFDVQFPDGGFTGWTPPIPGSGVSEYAVFSVYDNYCYLETLVSGYGGRTNDKLFVADDGQFYIHNSSSRLLTYSGDGNFYSIFPPGGFSAVPGIARALPQATQDSTLVSGLSNTIIAAISASDTKGRFQAPVETAGGWSLIDTTLSGFQATDLIWSRSATKGVIMGGKSSGTKIYRYDPSSAPFSTVVASDAGIPSGISSHVLDLEYGE